MIGWPRGIGDVGERLPADLARNLGERRVIRLRVRPTKIQNGIGKDAAFRAVQIANLEEDLREDVLIQPGVSGRRQRGVLPLQPTRRVDECAVLLGKPAHGRRYTVVWIPFISSGVVPGARQNSLVSSG